MTRRACARRGEGQPATAAGLEHFIQCRVAGACGNHQRKRHDGRQGDRLQVLFRIIGQSLDPVLIDGGLPCLPHQQSVPIGWRDYHALRADRSGSAWPVLDDDVLSQRGSKSVRDHPRHDIAGAAGRVGHNKMHCTSRKAFRPIRWTGLTDGQKQKKQGENNPPIQHGRALHLWRVRSTNELVLSLL